MQLQVCMGMCKLVCLYVSEKYGEQLWVSFLFRYHSPCFLSLPPSLSSGLAHLTRLVSH